MTIDCAMTRPIKQGLCVHSLQFASPSFRDASLGASLVIPGRRNASRPESKTTELRSGHDGAPIMFKSGSGGYGFRARAKWRAPE
jgi:hypothetical protein